MEAIIGVPSQGVCLTVLEDSIDQAALGQVPCEPSLR